MCRSVWALPQMSRWEMKRVQMSMAKAPLEKRRWDWEVLIGRISKGREEKTNCSPPSICFDKFGKGWHQVNWNSLVKGDIISLASKVMLKILQARLQQNVNCELSDVQAGFRKSRGTRHQITIIHWIIEKAREFQKNIYFCYIGYAKAFDCVDHNKLQNSSRDRKTRLPDLPPEKSVCRSRSNS